MNIYFKENYDSVIIGLKNKNFLIFGTTMYANIFYLYCVEKKLTKNIVAFIVSDISRYNKKVHMLHNIPVRDLDWLKKKEQSYSIFIAAKEETIQNQLIPLISKTACTDIFYVSDFVHNVMNSYFINLFFNEIIKKYVISSNLHEIGSTIISDVGSKNVYKYFHRIALGESPDPNIFNGNMKLNELHQKQLGDYVAISETGKGVVNNCDCKIYVAKSHYDKELKEKFYTPYTIDIQVGAALTDMDIAECKDNVGDNISIRNKDYCEVTAIYWIWKNHMDNDYIGICHYRRRFVINESMIEFIIHNKFDAVFTIPCLTDGGMRREFVERNYFLTPEAWELVERILLKISPEYFDTWLEFKKSYFIIPCNIFIMKKEIFARYCSWLFMILEETDKYYLDQGIQCDNRYLGYISECLTTVYVMKNKDILKKGYVRMKKLA